MCSRWKRVQDLSRFTVLIQKSKPDKSEARVLLKNQVNGPKAGREARWPDCFGVFILYEKGGIAGA